MVRAILFLVSTLMVTTAHASEANVHYCGHWDEEGGSSIKIDEASGIACVGPGPWSLDFCATANVVAYPIVAVRDGNMRPVGSEDSQFYREFLVRKGPREIATVRIYEIFPNPSIPEVRLRRAEMFGSLVRTAPLPTVSGELDSGDGFCMSGEDGSF